VKNVHLKRSSSFKSRQSFLNQIWKKEKSKIEIQHDDRRGKFENDNYCFKYNYPKLF
jgi:hypothetical protein